ncbi:metal-dependent hydrolase [Stenotrophomonas koreensis]|uniref:metal-dependent hydrolase n=1 Tax=Stenotrophomonas koreensis TaxID=266128 RepID=UPI00339ABAC5
MPFTPFHLGPGLALKALGGRHFSLMVFAGAQVLMDIEPLLGLLGLIDSLHGVSHSLAGALLIGLLATLTGRPIGNRMLRLLRWPAPPIDWPAAALGAFVGSLSHIALDALMHADIQPLWPLTTANPLRDALSWSALHGGCALLGLLGLLVIGLRHYHQARRR